MYFSHSHFSRSLDSSAEWSQTVPHKSLPLWLDLSKKGRPGFHHGSDAFSSQAGLLGIPRSAMNDTPLEKPDVADDRPVSVTALSSSDDFWLNASQLSLDAIWDNCEHDVYAELLEPDD